MSLVHWLAACQWPLAFLLCVRVRVWDRCLIWILKIEISDPSTPTNFLQPASGSVGLRSATVLRHCYPRPWQDCQAVSWLPCWCSVTGPVRLLNSSGGFPGIDKNYTACPAALAAGAGQHYAVGLGERSTAQSWGQASAELSCMSMIQGQREWESSLLDSDRSLCLMATGGRRASAPVTLRRTRIWLIMLVFVDTHQGGRVDGEKLFGPIASATVIMLSLVIWSSRKSRSWMVLFGIELWIIFRSICKQFWSC